MRLKKKNLLKALIILGLTAVFIFWGYQWLNKSFIPAAFLETRSRAAEVAKEIISLTENSIQTLDKISFYDRQYNFEPALSLVREELERAKKSRQKTTALTKEIGNMTNAIVGITPARARDLATQAVRDEVDLIAHLIVYSDLLNALLQTLEYKFSGDILWKSEEVQILIKNMNQEAREVNRLNDLFNQKMQELDKLVS